MTKITLLNDVLARLVVANQGTFDEFFEFLVRNQRQEWHSLEQSGGSHPRIGLGLRSGHERCES